MEDIYTPKQDYKVLVRCYTYNHSKYIEDALNGFVIQETNFPFVCLVVDDCSTDGEQNVIKSWMERECDMRLAEYIDLDLSNIVLVPHKSNQSCTFAFYFLKQNLYKNQEQKTNLVTPWREHCEYEAICEGDDWWIDPLKLQKQSHFLDNNEPFGLVGSSYSILNQETGKMSVFVPKRKKINFKQTLVSGGIGAATCSVLYRMEAIAGYNEFIKNTKWPLGDLSLWLYILRDSQAFVMDDITSTYRLLSESASHTKSYEKAVAFNQGIFDIQLFFAEKYDSQIIPLLKKKLNKRMFNSAIKYGKTKDAIKYAKGTNLNFKDYLRIIKSVFVNNQENNKTKI